MLVQDAANLVEHTVNAALTSLLANVSGTDSAQVELIKILQKQWQAYLESCRQNNQGETGSKLEATSRILRCQIFQGIQTARCINCSSFILC